jgi:hypothetical protein
LAANSPEHEHIESASENGDGDDLFTINISRITGIASKNRQNFYPGDFLSNSSFHAIWLYI